MTDSPAKAARPAVLVIDPNPVFRAAVAGFLHRRQIDVVGVASGEEGLQALLYFDLSLCLIDLLPAGRMTGVQAAEALHARAPALRFVFLSAFLEPSWAERPAFLESAPLLRKPVELEELASVVCRELRLETPPPRGPARRRPPGGGRGPHRPFERAARLPTEVPSFLVLVPGLM